MQSARADVECRGNVQDELRLKRLFGDAIAMIQIAGEAVPGAVKLGETNCLDPEIDVVRSVERRAVVAAPRIMIVHTAGLGQCGTEGNRRKEEQCHCCWDHHAVMGLEQRWWVGCRQLDSGKPFQNPTHKNFRMDSYDRTIVPYCALLHTYDYR